MLSRKAHAANIHLQMDAVQPISIKVIHLLGIFGLVGKMLRYISFLSPQSAERFSGSSKHLTLFKTLTKTKLIGKFTYYSQTTAAVPLLSVVV